MKASSFFGQACSKQPAPKYYLTLLAVDINAQGRGIGTAMIHECIVPFLKEEGCKLLCLNTNEEKNRNFYRKNKFDEIGESEIEINGKRIDFPFLACWNVDIKSEPLTDRRFISGWGEKCVLRRKAEGKSRYLCEYIGIIL